MIIKDIDKMEKIVESNESLKWNGWSVEHFVKDENAFMKNTGVFFKDLWYVKKTYAYDNGWNIPDSLVRNVQI
jgi:hypothetical protein